jgi:hypothetical protein
MLWVYKKNNSLFPNAASRSEREGSAGELIVRVELGIQPSLRNKIVRVLEVGGAVMGAPRADRDGDSSRDVVAVDDVAGRLDGPQEANGRGREQTKVLLDAGGEVGELVGDHQLDVLGRGKGAADLGLELGVFVGVAQHHVDEVCQAACCGFGASDTLSSRGRVSSVVLVQAGRQVGEQAGNLKQRNLHEQGCIYNDFILR